MGPDTQFTLCAVSPSCHVTPFPRQAGGVVRAGLSFNAPLLIVGSAFGKGLPQDWMMAWKGQPLIQASRRPTPCSDKMCNHVHAQAP
jgi:hypothetical protein